MIKTFKDKGTEQVFDGVNSKESRRIPRDIHSIARWKLDYLNVARKIEDLKVPPGNRLEALRGDLEGLHSIRVNDQWRIVFRWKDGDCYEVRITDYH